MKNSGVSVALLLALSCGGVDKRDTDSNGSDPCEGVACPNQTTCVATGNTGACTDTEVDSAIVDFVTSVSEPTDQLVTVGLQAHDAIFLDMTNQNEQWRAEMLDRWRQLGIPMYFEIVPTSRIIIDYLATLEGQVANLANEEDVVLVEFFQSAAIHALMRTNPHFDEFLAALENAKELGTWVLFTTDYDHGNEIYDVRAPIQLDCSILAPRECLETRGCVVEFDERSYSGYECRNASTDCELWKTEEGCSSSPECMWDYGDCFCPENNCECGGGPAPACRNLCGGEAGIACLEGFFCSLPNYENGWPGQGSSQCLGNFDSFGVCQKVPQDCNDQFVAEICACSDENRYPATYANDCLRRQAKASFSHAGACDALVVVGAFCTVDADCGAGYVCFAEHAGSACVPDGYCMLASETGGGPRACVDPSDCPAGTLCSPLPWSMISGVCLLACGSGTECREGYACDVVELFPGEPNTPVSPGTVCWTDHVCEP